VTITVVVPTLNEEAEIEACLARLRGEGPDREVLVADGGSTDATLARVPAGARVVRSAPGRARQLNAAARQATGDVLLFLHADCRLPLGALRTIELALQDPAVVGGAFHKRWRSASPWLRVAPRLRTSVWFRLGGVFGDQAMFVRRHAFEELGGFSEDAEAEDLDLALRLARRGRLVLLPPEVEVSARKLGRDGVLRTWASWWAIGLRQGARTVRAAWREDRARRAAAARGERAP